MSIDCAAPLTTPSTRRPEWKLTEPALRRLLEHFSMDETRAALEYEASHRRLIVYFQARGCLPADECADQTLDCVARRLDEGEVVVSIRAYMFGVARRIAAEHNRQEKRRRAAWAPLGPTDTESRALEAEMARLDAQLQRLPRATARLLLDYHRSDERAGRGHRRRLAERLGISYGALRTRVHRAHARLGAYLRGIR